MIRTSSALALAAALAAALPLAPSAVQNPPPPAPSGPAPGPDSQVQPGTPTGEVIQGEFAGSRVYPGTWREYWVYVPQQLDRSKPAPVMVFQDGLQYNAPVVFDNLIHRKQIPPMVGVFVMHGRVRAPSPRSSPHGSGLTRSAASSAPSAPMSACAAAMNFPC